MKSEERVLFETFIAVHPEFLECKSWAEGSEPPDVIITDNSGRRVGVELTEWLIESQTGTSIRHEEQKYERLNALDTENHAPAKNFAYVQLWFRHDTRFSERHRERFRHEFYDLIAHVDRVWEQEMQDTQKIWNDFTSYPALGREIYFMRFDDKASFRPTPGTRWALGTPRGGAYAPRDSTMALLETTKKKRAKANYTGVKEQHGLAEFVLLVHYGVRGMMHNTPFEGLHWKMEDVLREIRADLVKNPGPFDRVFLYLAYNEGQLFSLYH